ncbi:tetratricopeptide repeat protein [Candidatus Uabimicrobium amorphum]|uniref:Tetratricopeptide repeat domain protein n=1 Tax=Uabimicrobium amorphum TaxID=2596890 RepID=A0A5S9IRN7_UABAM|nr:tetratricopeptide repeat protein [Candidatus Uabimicrobium amorphum]BBM86873.1 tetratricopeptide repeat domain protein [Candidatus Uabimicrobium amorphum]
MKFQTTISINQHLAHIFNCHQAVVFCGAGISLEPPAGLPDWNSLRDYTLTAIAKKDKVLRKYLKSLLSVPMIASPGKKGMTPEVVASKIAKNCEGYFESFRALEDGEPNTNHRYLAKMAKAGLLKYIVTTNFDAFIEQALQKEGLKYQVYSSEEQFASFSLENDDGVHLLKIHGCIHHPQTITATVEQEAKGLTFSKGKVLEQLLRRYHFIFWGYSGADLKIDIDYLRMVSSKDKALGFVWNFLQVEDYKEKINPHVAQLARLYENKAHITHGKLPEIFDHLIANADQIERTMYNQQQEKEWTQDKNAKLQQYLEKWAKDHVTKEDACYIFADLLKHSGETQSALKCYQYTESLYAKAKNKHRRAVTLNDIALIYDFTGDFTKALNYYRQAEKINRSLGNEGTVAAIANNIGMLYKNQGDYNTALKYYDKAQKVFKSLNNKEALAPQLNNIATIYKIQGEYDRALKNYKEVEKIDRCLGNKQGLANTLNNIGSIHDSQGDLDTALDYYQQALKIDRALGNVEGLAIRLNNIGMIYHYLEEYKEALCYLQEAKEIENSLGNKQGVADSLSNIGVIYETLDDYDIALQHYREAEEIDRSLGNKQGLATRLNNIGGIYDLHEKYQEALQYYCESEQISRSLNDVEGLATSLNNIGSIYNALGNDQEALQYLQEALEITQNIGHIELAALCSKNIGMIYNDNLMDYHTAKKYYEESTSHYFALGDDEEVLELQQLIINCSKNISSNPN